METGFLQGPVVTGQGGWNKTEKHMSRLDIRRKFLSFFPSMRLVSQWNRFPRAVVGAPSVGVSKGL